MGLIQFTENYEDLSTDLGFQFKFFCDRCQNGYMSTFQRSALGTGASLVRAAGHMFGGIFGTASAGTYDIQRAVGGSAHDSALKEAVEEVRSKFHQCKRCGKWVCPDNCWNTKRGMCNTCAPDVQMELAAAQNAAAVEQINVGVRQVDQTGGIDMASEAAGTCPHCGAKTSGKFCGECGGTLVPKVACACGAQVDEGKKFCPECGKPMGAPVCPKCGKKFAARPKFCDDCGAKM